MPFTYRELEIPGVVLVEYSLFQDERGFFSEIFRQSEFTKNGIVGPFVQDNFSVSKKGVVRGLHYQLSPKTQGKLITVLAGRVLDFAVDIRRGSSTFLKSISVELSDKNNRMLYIPEGFAHGFVALSEEVKFFYKCTNEYSKEHERGIRFDDPDINIDLGIKNPSLSERDLALPFLKDAELL